MRRVHVLWRQPDNNGMLYMCTVSNPYYFQLPPNGHVHQGILPFTHLMKYKVCQGKSLKRAGTPAGGGLADRYLFS
jgi:hypothetical protein